MRKRYSRSYTVLSFLTMFSYREQPFVGPLLIEIDSGRLTHRLPASDAALAARPRRAVAAAPPKREWGAGSTSPWGRNVCALWAQRKARAALRQKSSAPPAQTKKAPFRALSLFLSGKGWFFAYFPKYSRISAMRWLWWTWKGQRRSQWPQETQSEAVLSRVR